MIQVSSLSPQEPDSRQFLLLMISEKTACLILASGVNAALPSQLVGVCLHRGASPHAPGNIRSDWEREQFTPFEPPITISNE